jgi:hypothetical protein
LHGEGGCLGEEFADLETGLQADRICAGEQKVQREGLKYMFWLASGAEGFRWRYEKAWT